MENIHIYKQKKIDGSNFDFPLKKNLICTLYKYNTIFVNYSCSAIMLCVGLIDHKINENVIMFKKTGLQII